MPAFNFNIKSVALVLIGATFLLLATNSDIFAMSSKSNIETSIDVECLVGGCSGELCEKKQSGADIDKYGGMMSMCLWKPKYDCYSQFGVCEVNISGECGWRKTDELTKCLQEKSKLANAEG